jgi:hypothetical protein
MLGLVGGQTESGAATGFFTFNAGSQEAPVQASSASTVLPLTASRTTSTGPRRSSQERHHDRHHHGTSTTTTTTTNDSAQTTIVGRPTSRNFNVQPCMCFCARSNDEERGQEEDQLFLSVPMIGTGSDENAFSLRNDHQQHHPLDELSPLRIFARPILVNTTALLQRMRTTTMKQQQQNQEQEHHLPVAAAIMYNAALFYHLKGVSSSSTTTGDGERSRDRAYQLADFYYSVALCHMEGALHHQRLCYPSVASSSTLLPQDADVDEATFVLPMLASWNNRAHLQCAHYSAATRSQCLDSMRKLLQVADVIARRIAYPPPQSSSVSASLAAGAAAECLLSPEERSIFRLNCFFLEQLGAGLAPAA